MRYSKGVMWLDDCRIPHNEPIKIMKPQDGGNKVYQQAGRREETTELKEQGRFTPNLLVCDDMLNDGSVSKSGSNRKNKEYKPLNSQLVNFGGGDKNYEPNDKGTNSRYYDLDKWFDKVIDEIQ